MKAGPVGSLESLLCLLGCGPHSIIKEANGSKVEKPIWAQHYVVSHDFVNAKRIKKIIIIMDYYKFIRIVDRIMIGTGEN